MAWGGETVQGLGLRLRRFGFSVKRERVQGVDEPQFKRPSRDPPVALLRSAFEVRGGFRNVNRGGF